MDTSRTSENTESRHGGYPQMLVWHATAGRERSDIPTLLGLTSRRVSAHYYITKDGRVFQFVPDNLAAWHAGVSSWLGHSSGWIQDNSIGIEMENLNNGADPYPQAQYDAAVVLAKSLVTRYHIDQSLFVRHLDIAPVRKHDPAGFPWSTFVRDVYGNLPEPTNQPANGGNDKTPRNQGARFFTWLNAILDQLAGFKSS